jgi:two-component system, LuxR family, response regulator FixJ
MPTAQRTPLVGVIEDDIGMRQGLSWLLAAAHFHVLAFASAEEFLQHTHGEEFDCLVIDVRLPGMDGFALRETLREHGRRVSALMVSGHDDETMREQFRRAGIARWLRKPFDGQTLIDAVNDTIASEKPCL